MRDDPSLDFDPSSDAPSMGEFEDREHLEVDVLDLSEFDVERYVDAIARVQTEGLELQAEAIDAVKGIQHAMKGIEKQLEVLNRPTD